MTSASVMATTSSLRDIIYLHILERNLGIVGYYRSISPQSSASYDLFFLCSAQPQ